MCTLSLVKQGQSLQLLMNRDERRQRHEAGLSISQDSSLTYCYPVDAQAGGTWAGANSAGVSLCLLNRYQVGNSDSAISRGGIIPAALKCGRFEQVLEHLRRLNYKRYNGFDCIVLKRDSGMRFSWDRHTATEHHIDLNQPYMFTSSSERLTEVSHYRRQLFNDWQRDNASKLGDFHLQQAAGEAASAVLMSRPHSHTKSIVHIAINPSDISLHYYGHESLRANSHLAELRPSQQWQSCTATQAQYS